MICQAVHRLEACLSLAESLLQVSLLTALTGCLNIVFDIVVSTVADRSLLWSSL